VADRLRSDSLATDTVARLGADEFAILATSLEDAADVAARADKLIEAFAHPFLVQGGEFHAGASIGLELCASGSTDPETLLSHAGMALDRAKSEGRGVARFFTQAMDAEIRGRVSLGVDLRNTIARNQLFVVFQPQVSLVTGRMTGVEALVRWRHPTLGLIGPNTFIPLAERMGLIGSLGSWVLWTACRQAKAWLDHGAAPLRMCVNVSALQFSGLPALEAEIAAALATTGLPAELLELELTESVLMSVSREHDLVLPRLRRTGVTVAIDDFGTGYSSFDYLRRFPVDRIKIAQNFITDLETAPGDGAIVRATIGLARELDINVIAEGVETRAQSELLKGWGCGEAQGYFFARPLAAEDVEALVHGDRRLDPRSDVQALSPA
jgi:predicted signal transduction protein with EAL and GGDEF domain